jgi:hypothetical protein
MIWNPIAFAHGNKPVLTDSASVSSLFSRKIFPDEPGT